MAKKEQTQNKEQAQSVILTPKQARAVTALQFERQEIARQANEQIAEIMEAFQEQGRMLSLVHQLPRDEGVTYRFDSVDVDGEPRVKMTATPAKPEQPDAEMPDEPQEQTEAEEEQNHGE